MKTFKASLDGLSKGITAFCFLLSIVIPAPLLLQASSHSYMPFLAFVLAVGASLILLILIIIMFLYRPLEYEIDDKLFSVNTPARKFKISRSNIKQVRPVMPDEIRFTIRTFGNGGIFGYTGWYYNRQLGSMRWFATQRRNYILIETIDSKKFIITPDDTDGFLKQISIS